LLSQYCAEWLMWLRRNFEIGDWGLERAQL
jgi:hypothetical protein